MVHSHTVHLPLSAPLTPCTMCGTGEDPVNYAQATNIYANGGCSDKPSSTIKGFSTSAETKPKGMALYDKFYAYYGDYAYAGPP